MPTWSLCWRFNPMLFYHELGRIELIHATSRTLISPSSSTRLRRFLIYSEEIHSPFDPTTSQLVIMATILPRSLLGLDWETIVLHISSPFAYLDRVAFGCVLWRLGESSTLHLTLISLFRGVRIFRFNLYFFWFMVFVKQKNKTPLFFYVLPLLVFSQLHTPFSLVHHPVFIVLSFPICFLHSFSLTSLSLLFFLVLLKLKPFGVLIFLKLYCFMSVNTISHPLFFSKEGHAKRNTKKKLSPSPRLK